MFQVMNKKTAEVLIEGEFKECWTAFKGVEPADRKGLVLKRLVDGQAYASSNVIKAISKAMLTADQKFNLGL